MEKCIFCKHRVKDPVVMENLDEPEKKLFWHLKCFYKDNRTVFPKNCQIRFKRKTP